MHQALVAEVALALFQLRDQLALHELGVDAGVADEGVEDLIALQRVAGEEVAEGLVRVDPHQDLLLEEDYRQHRQEDQDDEHGGHQAEHHGLVWAEVGLLEIY